MFSKTLSQGSITLIATIINGVLGLLFYIFSARFLGPANFGILTLSITTLTLIADIADFGTDTGLIRFVGKYFHSDKEKALRFMKLGIKIKLAVWLFILAVGIFSAHFIASYIFQKEELQLSLKLAFIGVGGALLFSFVTHSLQAMQKFFIWSALNISLNALRLLIIFLLIAVTTENILLTYITISFFGFFLGLLILPKFYLARNENLVASDMFHYNKWVGATSVLSALSSRLDLYLLARISSVTSLGIYSAANQLTIIIPQLVSSLATVIAPKLSAATTPKEVLSYLKKLQVLTLVLAGFGLLGIPLSFFVIPFFLGPVFADTINVFIILLLAQLIFLIATPSHQAIFYYFANPKIFLYISFAQFLILGLGGYFAISLWGIIGAAWIVLMSQMFSFLVSAAWVVYQFKKR